VSPGELAQELASGRLRPAYLLAGPEALLRDDALAALRERVLAGAPADFNADRLDGDSATPGALWDAVQTLPVLGPRRLVWLRESPGGRGGWRALAEVLPDVVRSLDEASSAVLVVTAGSLDRRLAWVKAFREPAAIVVCEPPRSARELADFVRAEARRQGVRLEGDAAGQLVERVGPQLLALRGELEKAALLAGPGAAVTVDHVTRAVADVAAEPIWELTDAIGEGRAGDALAVLGRLLEAGTPGPVVLGALASHFRRLLRAREGGAVAGPPFVVRKLRAQAGRYVPTRLSTCLRAIHETDEMLKGQGAIAPALALERLVLGLAA
jgi:DNA polymerase III subunit delta